MLYASRQPAPSCGFTGKAAPVTVKSDRGFTFSCFRCFPSCQYPRRNQQQCRSGDALVGSGSLPTRRCCLRDFSRPATTGFLGSGSVVPGWRVVGVSGLSPGSVTGCFAGSAVLEPVGPGFIGLVLPLVSSQTLPPGVSLPPPPTETLGFLYRRAGALLYLILAPRCHPTPSALSMWASG